MALVLASVAAYGVFLLYTSVALRWRGLRLGPALGPRRAGAGTRAQSWLTQAGVADVRAPEVLAVSLLLGLGGAALCFAFFGGLLPPLIAGLFAASFPIASLRSRRDRRRSEAREAWPRMIEEIRLLTGSLGRSVPQALFEVGRSAPDDMRPSFSAAQREWLISTDFMRTVAVLKHALADPTADAACETLLVAHEIGGTDLDRRLSALAEDRMQDLQGRKTAKAKQAGVKFARRFVLLVPLGMAVAGLSIGSGRHAYQTAGGQIGVGIGLALIVVCWIWASRLLRLPEEDRVFA